jgi:uncharacterized protein YggE
MMIRIVFRHLFNFERLAMALRSLAAVLAAGAWLGIYSIAAAQVESAGTVNGLGTARLERAPQLLRMQVQILSKGSDIREALTRLKARRTAAQAILESMGADKKSIQFGEMAVDAAMSDRQRQMEMMIRQQLPGRGKTADSPKRRPVTVSVQLIAEWPLKSDDLEELLIAAHELEQKVKDADVAGAKEAQKLSPEEEELAEEAAELMNPYGGTEEPPPGTPVFLYVMQVSDEERASLLKEAYQKASAQAGELAAAAGAKIGPLRQLDGSGDEAAGYGSNPYSDYYNSMAYQQMQAQTSKAANEAIGVKPGKIAYQVSVTASFKLMQSAERP